MSFIILIFLTKGFYIIFNNVNNRQMCSCCPGNEVPIIAIGTGTGSAYLYNYQGSKTSDVYRS